LGLTIGLAGAAFALGGYALLHDEDRDETPRIVEVPAATVVRLPTETDSRLVLEGDLGLDPGDFVTTVPDWEAANPHAPEGFLLQVEEVGTVGGLTTVATEPASLFDAVPDDGIEKNDLDGFTSVPEAVAEGAGVALARFVDDAESPAGELRRHLEETFKCKAAGRIELEPRVDAGLQPHIDLAWEKASRFRVRLNEASVWVDGSVEAVVGLRTEGSDECELARKTLWVPSWRFVIFVGQVPVPITLKLPVGIEARAGAEAAVKARAWAKIKAKAGLIYKQAAKPKVSVVKGVGLEGPSLDLPAEAKASAEAALVPGVEVVVGWGISYLGKLALSSKTELRGAARVEYEAKKSRESLRTCLNVKITSALYAQQPFSREPYSLSGHVSLYDEDLKCEPRKPKSEGKRGRKLGEELRDQTHLDDAPGILHSSAAAQAAAATRSG
jgi:hypothetical protein